MASFSVSFLGCKVSYADGQAVRERLLRDGHAEVAGGGDVAVVNTCCVTHEAISKSRQAVSRAAKSHGRVYVTGCGANLRGAFDGTAPNVTVVALASEEMPIAVSAGVGALGCVQADARLERTRAFVKIQDGCSFSCSFCVIPLVRGATRSRRADAVLGEIERRVAQGHREIVLTGVNLGCFRDREAGYTLPRLVREAGAAARRRAPATLVDRGQSRHGRPRRGAPRDARGVAPPPRAPAVRRRHRSSRDAAALLRRAVRREARAAGRLQPHRRRDRRLPVGRRAGVPSGRSKSSSRRGSPDSTSSRTRLGRARERTESIPCRRR